MIFLKPENPRTRKLILTLNPNPIKPETCLAIETRKNPTRNLMPDLNPNPKNFEPDPSLFIKTVNFTKFSAKKEWAVIYTTHCGKISHQRNISSNQNFTNLFSKTMTFTKCLSKMGEREFPLFPQCAGNLFSLFFGKYFVKVTFLL